MKKIIILLLSGAFIVSASEIDVNRQLKRTAEVKQKLLIEQQEKNRKLKQQIAVFTETADRIAGIKKAKKQIIRKLLYSNLLDGSRKIDKYSNSNKALFAKYVNSTLLIENNNPKERRNICGKWLKIPEGKKLIFSVWVKAKNVKGTRIKFGLMINNGKGKWKWPVANIGNGSFEWQKVSFSTVVPFGVESCLLIYGLETGTGKVYFKDIKAEIVE